MLINNDTPYVGKIKLSFTKNPNDVVTHSYSILNKIHLNLGFTKLVSRVFPFKLANGYHKLDKDKIELILLKTKGKIGIHEWWLCTSKKTGYNKTKYSKPDAKLWDILDHNILEESFVSQKNIYIGNIQDAWWYYKNNLEVYEPKPYGVAREFGENGETTGYYGYSHRGGALFEKGQRIFDSNYIAKKEDYPDWQWAGFVQEFEKTNWDYLSKSESPEITAIVPFNMRGKKIIETWDDAILAATNLSKYL